MSSPTHKPVVHTLENGLTVVSVPDRAAPLVGVNLWYAVGSRDEVQGKSGFAHLFEHLMFQGSRNVHGTEHFSYLQGVGGSLNGTTSFDRTNYYETVPKHAVELALWLEADRMATLPEALSQENLDNQRDVVKNEKRQSYDNKPYGSAWEHLMRLSFPEGHPYHHLPIGSMEDLDAASLEDTLSFFNQYYMPSNAVLTLAGDLAPEEAFALAEKYFGGIESPKRPERTLVPDVGPLDTGVSFDLAEDVPMEKVYHTWRVPAAPATENLALTLAMSVLTEGGSSRLLERLVRNEETAHSVSGSTIGLGAGSDLAVLVASVRPGEQKAEVADVIQEELQRFSQSGPTDLELQRAKAQYYRRTLESLSRVESLADEVSGATTLHGDPELPFKRAGQAAALTCDDLQKASQFLLNPHTTLTYSTPKKES